MASRCVLLLLTVIASLCATPAAAVGNPSWLDGHCSTKDNYTDGSQYKKNLDELLAALPAAAGDNGWFYNGTAGLPGTPDQVFGLVMCYADRNAKQCQECLADAPARITSECPGSRNVSAAYDACVLRYSPASFSIADLDVGVLEATSVAGVTVDPTKMFNAWLKLMTGLTGQAASSPSRVANGTTAYDGDAAKLVYGLAQCTRDLNGSECSGCLSSVVGQLTATFKDQTGGAIKAYSCYVKYQLGAFDITLPPEPPQPSPQPPPPPSPAQLGESSSSSKRALVIGLSVGSVSSLIILGSLIYLSLRRRKQAKILKESSFLDGDDLAMEDDFEKGTGPKRFRYGELAMATDSFSD